MLNIYLVKNVFDDGLEEYETDRLIAYAGTPEQAAALSGWLEPKVEQIGWKTGEQTVGVIELTHA